MRRGETLGDASIRSDPCPLSLLADPELERLLTKLRLLGMQEHKIPVSGGRRWKGLVVATFRGL